MLDKETYIFHEVLSDGTEVTLRAARADDGPKILRAFRGLGQDTVYSRFFGYKSAVSDAELKRITHADFIRDVSLLSHSDQETKRWLLAAPPVTR